MLRLLVWLVKAGKEMVHCTCTVWAKTERHGKFFFCWHKFSPSRRSEKDQVLFSAANRIGSELEGTSILVPCSKSCSIKRPKMSLYSLGAPDSLGHSKIEFAKQQNKQRFTMKKQRVESFSADSQCCKGVGQEESGITDPSVGSLPTSSWC